MTEFDYRAIDDVIHSRVRLAIMSFLMTAGKADFSELKKQVQVSDGNLSTHLKKLEDHGYVTTTKQFVDKKPQTSVELTKEGKASFRSYVEGLAAMIGPLDDQ